MKKRLLWRITFKIRFKRSPFFIKNIRIFTNAKPHFQGYFFKIAIRNHFFNINPDFLG